eukprot:CAMPEP_0170627706 /NCGR_PEP_ID=MMETSP0224-20130122/32143_1 /TAXON_ID=285029 /ORGANISM="Togula jolla, Strain CCCM 725" /LENGTH=103 /DNA_ID=CAMNT_0010954781 /DNA_START=186 /DNA_END=494 /DNA_ORIENTATION=+
MAQKWLLASMNSSGSHREAAGLRGSQHILPLSPVAPSAVADTVARAVASYLRPLGSLLLAEGIDPGHLERMSKRSSFMGCLDPVDVATVDPAMGRTSSVLAGL